MAEVTNELMYEILKSMQDRLVRMDAKLDLLASSDRTSRSHMAAFMGAEVVQDTRLAELDVRIARIERQLELID